jgi:CBS domain-containing protein
VVARRYGIHTEEIVMFPIGGVSRMEREPKPREEMWIALAGPAVNLVLAAAALGIALWRGHGFHDVTQATDANLLERIGLGNLALAVFNLLPAFPMDGGRILRAMLARRRPESEATRIAAASGRLLAIAMGLFGLLAAQFFLVFIAFFVYVGAAQEGMAAMGRTLTQGIPVRAAMVTDFRTLPHGATVREAANLLLATSQQDFPVINGDQVIGLLGRTALVRAVATEGPDAYVAGVMDRDYPRLAPDTDLSEVLQVMARAGACALVMQDDKLLGLLTAENLSEFLLLRKVGMPPEAVS